MLGAILSTLLETKGIGLKFFASKPVNIIKGESF